MVRTGNKRRIIRAQIEHQVYDLDGLSCPSQGGLHLRHVRAGKDRPGRYAAAADAVRRAYPRQRLCKPVRQAALFGGVIHAPAGLPVYRADIDDDAAPAFLHLLDSGAGTGTAFDWSLIRGVTREYLLAGGLTCENVAEAIRSLRPWGVDVSSGIETNGLKDREKMAAFVAAVRKEDAQ